MTTSIQGANVALASGQTLDRAINAINTAWARPEQIYNNQLTSKVALMNYEPGDKLEFYMRMDGQADVEMGDTETRNFGRPQGVKVASVGFARRDIMAELLPMYTNRDPMKLFLGPTEEGVMKAMRLPTRQVALLLTTGLTTNCLYDGLPFFSTSHLVNPADSKNKKTFPNYFTSFQLTEAGWTDFVDQYEQIDGANDYKINQGFSNSGCVIWCAQQRQATKLMKIFDPDGRLYQGNTATPATDTAAAAVSTVFTPKFGYQLPMIEVVPELVVAGSAVTKKRLFVFNTRYALRRAIVVRVPRGMVMKINRTANNPYEASNNAYPMWADMEYGQGFGLPHLGALLEEP